ncbi:hypothetical protein MTZ49_10560 [Entomomonas sp. E2T0]|uniref:hypothetical protein n=1 Tax=Entomomonas sp. E2T0 TaxID=2930213 RepID=UPI0022283A77|nr:hypothetical protein [Entomomonas sp. E2T0]UYZ83043.1 hypothetical protein MTZ49_10560 [Entomomonas sp. E2T0]
MSDIIFPSGLSSQRAKKRAKELVKSGQFKNLSKALDFISFKEIGMPWALATYQLKSNYTIPINQNYLITTTDIERIMEQEPLLTHHGFEYEDFFSDSFYQRYEYSSRENYRQRFKEKRENLKNALEECQKCCLYLQHLNKLKTIRYRLGSYGLKWSVEQYHYQRGLSHDDAYVSNGSFICAAIHMGFKVIRKTSTSPNAWICASVNSDIILWEKFTQDWYTLSPKEEILLKKIKQRIGIL